MPTFETPLRDGNSMVGPPGHPLNPLMHHYGNWAQGITVWKDSLGVWHESLAPYLGGATQTTHNQWINGVGPVTTVTGPDQGLATALRVYDGGHVHTISDAEATELTAAGYGAQITTRTSIADDFNGPDGPMGADLTWTEEIFVSQPYFTNNVANQVWFHTTTPGSWEEIRVPYPGVDSPNVQIGVDVVAVSVTGTGEHHVGTGAIARYEPHSGGTQYRGYACEISRSETFFPPSEIWVLIIWKIAQPAVPVLLAIDTEVFANVTLPGRLTFTANGPNLSATFTHAGAGPTLTAAGTDSTFSDGKVALGWGHVQSGDEACTTIIDNFTAGPP